MRRVRARVACGAPGPRAESFMPRKPVACDRAEPGSPDSRAMSAWDGDRTALGDGVADRARPSGRGANQGRASRRGIGVSPSQPGGGGTGSKGPRRAIRSSHLSRSGPGGHDRDQRARVSRAAATRSSSGSMGLVSRDGSRATSRESTQNHQILVPAVAAPR
jgi:hypothetical protein